MHHFTVALFFGVLQVCASISCWVLLYVLWQELVRVYERNQHHALEGWRRLCCFLARQSPKHRALKLSAVSCNFCCSTLATVACIAQWLAVSRTMHHKRNHKRPVYSKRTRLALYCVVFCTLALSILSSYAVFVSRLIITYEGPVGSKRHLRRCLKLAAICVVVELICATLAFLTYTGVVFADSHSATTRRKGSVFIICALFSAFSHLVVSALIAHLFAKPLHQVNLDTVEMVVGADSQPLGKVTHSVLTATAGLNAAHSTHTIDSAIGILTESGPHIGDSTKCDSSATVTVDTNTLNTTTATDDVVISTTTKSGVSSFEPSLSQRGLLFDAISIGIQHSTDKSNSQSNTTMSASMASLTSTDKSQVSTSLLSVPTLEATPSPNPTDAKDKDGGSDHSSDDFCPKSKKLGVALRPPLSTGTSATAKPILETILSTGKSPFGDESTAAALGAGTVRPKRLSLTLPVPVPSELTKKKKVAKPPLSLLLAAPNMDKFELGEGHSHSSDKASTCSWTDDRSVDDSDNTSATPSTSLVSSRQRSVSPNFLVVSGRKLLDLEEEKDAGGRPVAILTLASLRHDSDSGGQRLSVEQREEEDADDDADSSDCRRREADARGRGHLAVAREPVAELPMADSSHAKTLESCASASRVLVEGCEVVSEAESEVNDATPVPGSTKASAGFDTIDFSRFTEGVIDANSGKLLAEPRTAAASTSVGSSLPQRLLAPRRSRETQRLVRSIKELELTADSSRLPPPPTSCTLKEPRPITPLSASWTPTGSPMQSPVVMEGNGSANDSSGAIAKSRRSGRLSVSGRKMSRNFFQAIGVLSAEPSPECSDSCASSVRAKGKVAAVSSPPKTAERISREMSYSISNSPKRTSVFGSILSSPRHSLYDSALVRKHTHCIAGMTQPMPPQLSLRPSISQKQIFDAAQELAKASKVKDDDIIRRCVKYTCLQSAVILCGAVVIVFAAVLMAVKVTDESDMVLLALSIKAVVDSLCVLLTFPDDDVKRRLRYSTLCARCDACAFGCYNSQITWTKALSETLNVLKSEEMRGGIAVVSTLPTR